MKKTIEILWCDHCDTDTRHEYHDHQHERDVSCNSETCLVCGWWRIGDDGPQLPPVDKKEYS